MEDHIDERALQAIERSELPYLLFAADVGLHFKLDPLTARRAIREGCLGPWILVDGEPAVTRDGMKEYLRIRMGQVEEENREVIRRGL